MHYIRFTYNIVATKKTLKSRVIEKEVEIKSLQEMVISLNSKLKESEKDKSFPEKSTKGT